MKQGITVTTWSGGKEPCLCLLKSLWNVEYPVLVVINGVHETPKDWMQKLYRMTGEQGWHIWGNDFDGFEIGAIQATLEHTEWDEFVLLQESIEIKDKDVFRLIFEEYPGQSVSYNPHFQMYLGKYRREILSKLTLPTVRTKVEAVRQEEVFAKQYRDADPDLKIFNSSFIDEAFYTSWDDMFGRRNLKMEDAYLIKRKGTWDASQLLV